MEDLLAKIKQCTFCKEHLPHGPRPVVQINSLSKIIIIGQAPGRIVHNTGIPWNDASGKTLRQWLNIDKDKFYDPAFVSLMPMGFCYPGKGTSGDLAPRKECAPLWHPQILDQFVSVPLIVLIGKYAQSYYLKEKSKISLTENVRAYKDFLPFYFPLPHPSPRNQNWVKMNPWFKEDVIPDLQNRISVLFSPA